MIPNVHQSIDEIIRSASPAEKILWQQIRLLVGEYSAVQQFYFCGAIAGTELLTYSANRLFLYLSLEAHSGLVGSGSTSGIATYDENNTLSATYQNQITYWDATAAAARYSHNMIRVYNGIFSRLLVTSYTTVKIIGYKLTR